MKVGVFGLLGSGNLGNDASLAAVLRFLRSAHPDAEISAFCGGPAEVRERFGIPATRLHWSTMEYQTARGVPVIAAKALGKLVDVVRTAAWVRRQDVVIVPGMGVLEATLPLRPWGFPYSLFLLCAAGRLVGTPVALVGVGSNVINQRATRALVRSAARLATYRSYRDELSRDALRDMGVDTSDDEVYPDLAFALPVPDRRPVPGRVGVGVMAFHGGNDDRARADALYQAYLAGMKRFVRWLCGSGREVLLFTGDRVDDEVVAELVADSPAVTVAEVSDMDGLLAAMSTVEFVVASRYHNVLGGLRLARATLAIGYASKHRALMAGFGMAEFCHPVATLDVDVLIEQFTELERRSAELSTTLAARHEVTAYRLQQQFAALSGLLHKENGPTHEVRGGLGAWSPVRLLGWVATQRRRSSQGAVPNMIRRLVLRPLGQAFGLPSLGRRGPASSLARVATHPRSRSFEPPSGEVRR